LPQGSFFAKSQAANENPIRHDQKNESRQARQNPDSRRHRHARSSRESLSIWTARRYRRRDQVSKRNSERRVIKNGQEKSDKVNRADDPESFSNSNFVARTERTVITPASSQRLSDAQITERTRSDRRTMFVSVRLIHFLTFDFSLG